MYGIDVWELYVVVVDSEIIWVVLGIGLVFLGKM